MKPSEALIKGRELVPDWHSGTLFGFEWRNSTPDDLSLNITACALGAMWVGYYNQLPTPDENGGYWWNDWEAIYVKHPCDCTWDEGDIENGADRIDMVIAHLSDIHTDTFPESKMVEWLQGMGL